MVPQRDEITKGLLDALMGVLAQRRDPLVCLEENIVDGQDDWGDDNDGDETRHVGFWWGIFGRGQ